MLASHADGCDIAGAVRLGNVDEAATAIDKVHAVVVHNSPQLLPVEQLTEVNHDCGDSAMVETRETGPGAGGAVPASALVPHNLR